MTEKNSSGFLGNRTVFGELIIVFDLPIDLEKFEVR